MQQAARSLGSGHNRTLLLRVCWFVAVVSLASALAAQSSDAASHTPNLVIQTTVSRVIEDVVVTDIHGNPVRNLGRGDFALREDNKPQKLLSFEEHDSARPDFVPPPPPLPPNTFVDLPTAPEQSSLLIILYDMVNMELPEQAYARTALFRFIDSKPPGTRIAIFSSTDRMRLIQGFTQDKSLLHTALSSTGPEPHLPNVFLYGANYGKGSEEATSSLFIQLAEYLEGVPGRKAMRSPRRVFLLRRAASSLLAAPAHTPVKKTHCSPAFSMAIQCSTIFCSLHRYGPRGRLYSQQRSRWRRSRTSQRFS